MPAPAFPTYEHERAAEAITEFFRSTQQVSAVLLVNSVARGKATRDSCLDIAILLRPEVYASARGELEREWFSFYENAAVFRSLREAGRFAVVHLNFTNGVYVPPEPEESTPPDSFELEIGNHLAYSFALWEGGDYLTQLRRRWLPYYSEELRRERLDTVRRLTRINLEHVPWYISRDLHFAAFDRLYMSMQQTLQAVMIAHRTYPISYNKWIREQVMDMLQLPELYRRLPPVLEIQQLLSNEMEEKARLLESILEEFAQPA